MPWIRHQREHFAGGGTLEELLRNLLVCLSQLQRHNHDYMTMIVLDLHIACSVIINNLFVHVWGRIQGGTSTMPIRARAMDYDTLLLDDNRLEPVGRIDDSCCR